MCLSLQIYGWYINKTSLLEKEDFYSHLSIEDITDAEYSHAKRVLGDIWENIMICMLKVIHYCQLMYSKTLKICVYMNLILQNFSQLNR